MNAPTRRHPTSPAARQKALARRLALATRVVSSVVGVLLVALVVMLATREGPPPTVATDLPNPMGGTARAAPSATGQPVALGDLEVAAPDVVMGDVPLNTTLVPRWEVTNTTAEPQTFTVGQPQVLEGCCPGPVYVGDEEVPPGGTVTVEPGAAVMVQFPLQMHPGMDGQHHLTVPLLAGDAATELHVTGNFTATA